MSPTLQADTLTSEPPGKPLPRSLLISWMQSPSAVILEPPKIKSHTVSSVSPSISHEVMGYQVAIKHGIKTVQGEVGSWWTEGGQAHNFFTLC